MNSRFFTTEKMTTAERDSLTPGFVESGTIIFNTTINQYQIWDGIVWASIGSGMPGVPDKSVQFNDGGVFGGDAAFTYDKTLNALQQGTGSVASGANSSAQGLTTQATGAQARAEGELTVAGGTDSHAEGKSSQATAAQAHAEGELTLASAVDSHAEGKSTQATAAQAHAEGELTLASGIDSHAEGKSTQATGAQAHAEGESTVASGLDSHAEGKSTEASGINSHAEGDTSKATGEDAHAQGFDTLASGDAAHAEGYQTTSTKFASHAEGWDNDATGDYSHAEGNLCVASEAGAHAEGSESVASGIVSHAEGTLGLASGFASHVEGYDNTASGDFGSHAGGIASIASGLISRVSGQECVASAQCAFAHGTFAQATAPNAIAIGVGVVADQPSQHVVGRYNDILETDGYFQVGGGQSVAPVTPLAFNAFSVTRGGQARIRTKVLEKDVTQDLVGVGPTIAVGFYSYIPLTASGGAVTTSAVTAIAAGVRAGQCLTLENRDAANNITIKNAAGVRLPGGVDYVLTPRSIISFIWNEASLEWRTSSASSN